MKGTFDFTSLQLTVVGRGERPEGVDLIHPYHSEREDAVDEERERTAPRAMDQEIDR